MNRIDSKLRSVHITIFTIDDNNNVLNLLDYGPFVGCIMDLVLTTKIFRRKWKNRIRYLWKKKIELDMISRVDIDSRLSRRKLNGLRTKQTKKVSYIRTWLKVSKNTTTCGGVDKR